MLWQRLRTTLKDAPAEDLNVGAGTAVTVLVRMGSYGLAAVTGIVVARAVGAHDRGVYSLITTIALMFAAFSPLGISKAGIYLVAQRRCSLQQLISNDLAWLLAVSAIWVSGTLALGVTRPAFVPGDLEFVHFLIIALGGAVLLLINFARGVLMASGSVLGYNAIAFSEILLRGILIIGGVVLFGLGLTGVLSGWLLAIILAGLLALYLMAKRGRLKPALRLGLLRAQLSYGLRDHGGFIFQAANHRLDVFLVAAFVGTTALGYYAVAFGLAELLLRIPFALGVVLFPKLSALDPQANAQTAAVTCRRALFITLLGALALLATGRFLIGSLYGAEFLPGVTAFYILLPSALLYTVYRVLSDALAGRGMPEVSLYGGLASLPVTVGLGLLLIPTMGIEGAAIATVAAYAVSATVILAIFLRVTRLSLLDILLVSRADITSSWQAARTLLTRTEAVGAE